jgi:uncharacterized protein YdeI (YjbR/CyaY-like superfamily)
MDFYKVPMGFGMALSMNPFALNAYSALTEEEKVEILKRAHNAKNEQEMRQIVDGIAK